MTGNLLFLFYFSFVFLENLNLDATLSSHFPVMIILVTGTHQYFIHNTLGGSNESPLPRIYRLLRMQEPFLFCDFTPDLPHFTKKSLEKPPPAGSDLLLYCIFHFLHFPFCPLLICMIVNSHGHCYVAVPHNRLKDLRVHTGFCHSCASGMS